MVDTINDFITRTAYLAGDIRVVLSKLYVFAVLGMTILAVTGLITLFIAHLLL